MIITILLIGFVTGAAIGWLAGRRRASAAVMHVNRALCQEIRYWQDATSRATQKAHRAAEEARTWAEGCRQGRQDVISIVPLLMAAREQPAPAPSPADGMADCS